MRIISDFKDYYDCLASRDSLIYNRKTTSTDIQNPLKRSRWERKFWDDYGSKIFCAKIVGFCGDIFVVFEDYDAFNFYFSQDEVEEEINLKYYEHHGVHYVGFDLPEGIKSHFYQYFDYQTPIWFITYYYSDPDWLKLIRNPLLKGKGFVNHFGLEQTFQKVEMYLGGLAHPEGQIPPVSDLDMIEAKGFDLKTSFRKSKGEKRIK